MDREKNKIKLPITKKEVEVYTYITGGEKRQMIEILTSDVSATLQGEAKGDIPLSLVYKANDKVLELLVVSIDGNTDNVLSQINSLPSDDYDFLLAEVNKVSNDSSFSKKKTA